MEWICRLVDWIKKETWWRKYYRKYNLSDAETWRGKCMFCDAIINRNDIPECNIIKGRFCPCKQDECLIIK